MVFVSQFSQENEIFILTHQINPSLEERDRMVVPGLRKVAHILPNVVIGQISENIFARIPPHAVIVVRIDPAKYHHRFPVGQEKGRFCDVLFCGSQGASAHFIPEQFKWERRQLVSFSQKRLLCLRTQNATEEIRGEKFRNTLLNLRNSALACFTCKIYNPVPATDIEFSTGISNG